MPDLAEALRAGDLARGFQLIDGLASKGADLRHFARELVDYLRALVVAKSGAATSMAEEYRHEEMARLKASSEDWSYQRLLAAIKAFGELDGRMKQESFSQLHLEMAFMEVTVLEAQAQPSGMPAVQRPRPWLLHRPCHLPSSSGELRI